MTHKPEIANQDPEAEIARRADAYLEAAQKMTKAEGVKHFTRIAEDDPEAFAAILGRVLDEEAENNAPAATPPRRHRPHASIRTRGGKQ